MDAGGPRGEVGGEELLLRAAAVHVSRPREVAGMAVQKSQRPGCVTLVKFIDPAEPQSPPS